jgi:hypothetical protein
MASAQRPMLVTTQHPKDEDSEDDTPQSELGLYLQSNYGVIMPALPSSNPFDDYADDKRSLADQSDKLYWRKGELLVQAKTLPLRELEFKMLEAERIAASKLKTSIRKAKASVRKRKQATMTSFFIKK